MVVNSIAANSILIDEVNGLREKLGLKGITKKEFSEKMEKLSPHAERQLSELLKKR